MHVYIYIYIYTCMQSKKISNKIKWMYIGICPAYMHAGLQSTQTRRHYSSNNTGKQGACMHKQRGTLSRHLLIYISGCTASCIV